MLSIISDKLEQLLNLVWLVTVAALLLAVHTHPHRVARGTLVSLGAFVCIAMLLFPVISASDDLHQGFDLSDDAAWRHEKRSFAVFALLALVMACVAALLCLQGRMLPCSLEVAAMAQDGFLRRDLGRAPPQTL